jgi:rod shape-determining protein MreD
MKYVVALVVTLLLATFEVSFMPYFQVLGVTPSLVLMFVASWSVVRGQDEAFVVVPLSGFIRDLVTSDPLGTSALALTPIVLLAAAVQLRSMDSDFVPTIVVVAAGSLAFGIISIIILATTGQRISWMDGIWTAVLPLVVVNALFTPIVYLPVRWLGARSTTRILGPNRITSPL